MIEEELMKSKNKDATIQVLGAYGTKTKEYGTTSFLLNATTTIDAGNLLNSLEENSIDIETIWLTHSHLDHIVDIAHILDNYFHLREKTLTIKALPETIRAIQENFLNDAIWPDFSRIKLNGQDIMAIAYEEIEAGKKYDISDHETITPFLTDHTVASCGYIYTVKDRSSIMISTDTYSLKNIQDIIDNNVQITSLVLECSFSNSMKNLAIESKHLTPELLFGQLNNFKRDDFTLYINHIKPSYKEKIYAEIELYRAKWHPKILNDKDFITF